MARSLRKIAASVAVAACATQASLAAAQSGQLPVVALQGQSSGDSQRNDYGQPAQSSGPPPAPVTQNSGGADESIVLHEPVQKLQVQPGVNEIVKVATDHLNRIETPFANPEVMTVSSNASTQIKSNVVYVAPTGSQAVTMFINEKGDESASISLTLVPRRIPPRAFQVTFLSGQTYSDHSEAERWETSSPYQDSITKLLRKIAQKKIPPGYSMGNSSNIDAPFCRQEGLVFDFKQKIMGRNFWVAIGTMTNRSGHRVEFNEDSCMYEQRVAAVAAWPAIILDPGEVVEIYTVIRHVADTDEAAPERPSLISEREQAASTISGENRYQPAESGPYKIMLPPFESERIARSAVAKLRTSGFPAETYNQAGKLFVRIPGYPTQSDAQTASQMIQRLGFAHLVIADEDYR